MKPLQHSNPSPQPGVAQSNLIGSTAEDRIKAALEHTERNFKCTISLSEVSAVACMSVSVFTTHFRRITGRTFVDYLNELRIRRACTLLMEGNYSVKQVFYESGFNSKNYFHRTFYRQMGETPHQYRLNFRSKKARSKLPAGN